MTYKGKYRLKGAEMSENLKPCPFCGGEPDWNMELDESNSTRFGQWWRIECMDCSALGPLEENEYLAVREWNKRYDD